MLKRIHFKGLYFNYFKTIINNGKVSQKTQSMHFDYFITQYQYEQNLYLRHVD